MRFATAAELWDFVDKVLSEPTGREDLPPELPRREYSRKRELWDGIVGIKGQYGRKWYIPCPTAAYGHFGRKEFEWERVNTTEELLAKAK